MKILKILLLASIVMFVVLVATYGALFLKNNSEIQPVESDAISESLEISVQWLVDNKESLLNENNPMLWWMLKRSGETTKDYRIISLYKEYSAKYVDSNTNNIWRPLFGRYSYIKPAMIKNLPDYNQYFLYGLTCDKKLGELKVIQAQMATDFCANVHPISPACITHQLMGLRFRLDSSCGDNDEILAQIKQLQEKIVWQLTWDVRVVDVYLQRVLMLIDTGASSQVKNKWLKNILDQQLNDGGWGPNQPLLSITKHRYIGFSSKGINIVTPESSFHATAQGVLIMSLLSSM